MKATISGQLISTALIVFILSIILWLNEPSNTEEVQSATRSQSQ